MKKKGQVMIVGIIILVIASAFIGYKYLNNPQRDNSEGDNTLDSLAQCLTDSELKMYGTEWCGYCKKQKELFGDSFQYVDYIDCDKNKDTCVTEGITGYPTWKTPDGNAYQGVKELDWLGELVGCEI